MLEILVFITVAALIIHTFVCLTYFVSSIWEKEKRAGIFAGLQHLYARLSMEPCQLLPPSAHKDPGVAQLDGAARVYTHG